jgi:hypothetical protein
MKIERIEIEKGFEYVTDKYPNSGCFIISWTDVDTYIMVNKRTSMCFILGPTNEWGWIGEQRTKDVEIKTEEPVKTESNLSESFVLKMLATSLSNEETKRQILNKD